MGAKHPQDALKAPEANKGKKYIDQAISASNKIPAMIRKKVGIPFLLLVVCNFVVFLNLRWNFFFRFFFLIFFLNGSAFL